MKTQLDFQDKAFDDEERHFLQSIQNKGWFAHHIFGDDEGPGFSFTTGFWHRFQMPEVVVFSMKQETAHSVLGGVFDLIESGKRFELGRPFPDVLINDVIFLPVDKGFFHDYLGWSRWFYLGDNFECAQLVWPTQKTIFPWSDNAPREYLDAQPDLTGGDWLGRRQ